MRRIKALLIICLLGIAALLPSFVIAQDFDFPAPTGFVNDFEGILNNEEELEQRISQFQQETSNEIAVVTVEDFDDTTIEDYAVNLFEEWGIGTEDNDNGVLILVSGSQRESRIEVGYGLEGALPDALTGRIQDNEMIPYFKEGDYSTGVSKGVDAVISATRGEYVNDEQTQEPEASPLIAFIALIIIMAILSSASRGLPMAPITGAFRGIGGLSGAFGGSGRSGGGRSGGFGGFGGGRSGGGGSSRSW